MTSDEDLLSRALSDPTAFGVFYRRHSPVVLGFLVRRTGSAEVGAELTAEVFASAFDRAHTFDAERASALTWLFAIARHLLADYHRSGAVRRKAQRRLGIPRIAMDDDALERVEQLASLDVSATLLGDALDALPAEQRQAVLARIVHELSYDEIGQQTAVTSATARQRVSRGLAALRQRVGGQA